MMRTRIERKVRLLVMACVLLLTGTFLTRATVQDLSQEESDMLIGGALSGCQHQCMYKYYCHDSPSCKTWDEDPTECEKRAERDQIDHYKWWICVQQSGFTNCQVSNAGDCAIVYHCEYDYGSNDCDKEEDGGGKYSYRTCNDKNGQHN